MAKYRYMGYGTTNNEGIAKLDHDKNGSAITHSYTGTGAGEIDVVASLDEEIVDSSIVSETYEILDCAFYDIGTTGTPSTEWWKGCSSSTISSDATGLTFSNSTTTWCLFAINKPNTPKQSVSDLVEWNDFVMECTYHSATGNCSVDVRDSASHLAQATIDTSAFADGDIIRLEYTNDVAKFYKNGEKLTTDKTNCIGDVMIRFSVKEGTLCISDVKVYPI